LILDEWSLVIKPTEVPPPPVIDLTTVLGFLFMGMAISIIEEVL